MSIKIDMKDNSKEILDALERAVDRGLEAVGMLAEGYAKGELYEGHGLDTGRLRSSIAYATPKSHSKGQGPAKPEDYAPRGTPEDGTVVIGTNVEYAKYVELGARGRAPLHFLKSAGEGHSSEYQAIFEDSMKNA